MTNKSSSKRHQRRKVANGAGDGLPEFFRKSPLAEVRLDLERARDTGQTGSRASVVIDDRLMRDALRITGLKTKREVVELGLRTLVRLAGSLSFEDIRKSLFPEGPPKARTLEEMKAGIAAHMRNRHKRR